MNKNTKRGFQALEAAILLPIFIIAILTFGYLIKVAEAEESIIHAMADEGRRLSQYAYNIKWMPGFTSRLEKRLENEALEDLKVHNFLYRYHYAGKDDMITFRVSCRVKNILPLVFYDEFDLSRRVLLRGFTGRERPPAEVDYAEMEKEEASRVVWVFPIAGERYHEKTCSYIQVAAKEGTLDKKIRRKYGPCELCKPEDLPNGSLVYHFEKAGEAYHRGACHIVDRYVVSIEETDAVQKGYKPCSKC